MLGISTSSKVWSLDEKKAKYFVEWCLELGRKIGDPEMDKLELPLSDLDSGKIVDEFPDKDILQQARAILASFDNPIVPVEITIVQPGLKTANLTTTQQAAFERIKTLLSGAESFLQDVSSCQLSVMYS